MAPLRVKKRCRGQTDSANAKQPDLKRVRRKPHKLDDYMISLNKGPEVKAKAISINAPEVPRASFLSYEDAQQAVEQAKFSQDVKLEEGESSDEEEPRKQKEMKKIKDSKKLLKLVKPNGHLKSHPTISPKGPLSITPKSTSPSGGTPRGFKSHPKIMPSNNDDVQGVFPTTPLGQPSMQPSTSMDTDDHLLEPEEMPEPPDFWVSALATLQEMHPEDEHGTFSLVYNDKHPLMWSVFCPPCKSYRTVGPHRTLTNFTKHLEARRHQKNAQEWQKKNKGIVKPKPVVTEEKRPTWEPTQAGDEVDEETIMTMLVLRNQGGSTGAVGPAGPVNAGPTFSNPVKPRASGNVWAEIMVFVDYLVDLNDLSAEEGKQLRRMARCQNQQLGIVYAACFMNKQRFTRNARELLEDQVPLQQADVVSKPVEEDIYDIEGAVGGQNSGSHEDGKEQPRLSLRHEAERAAYGLGPLAPLPTCREPSCH
eukprot:TRINITY_DN968_c0_g1_i1.p1 TRINITY_DN968_c0_g1~~TRINITY_DN968_c0_g1_i1.p1  ORF type:complete len:479 (+),score=93.19 TRINITY_DN968_c0_g1_i1:61-1497(+)